MPQRLDLKEAEKRAFRLGTSQDGLYDLFWGFYMIALSFSSLLLDMGLERPWNSLLIGGIAMVGLLVVFVLKKAIIVPRSGRVKFGRERKRKFLRVTIMLWISAAIPLSLLGLTLTGYFGGRIFENLPEWLSGFRSVGLFGVVVIILFSVYTHTLDVPRLHLYGWLLAISFSSSAILEEFAGMVYHVPVAVGGLIVIGIGFFILIRFLRSYPVATEPIHSEN